jgi:nuclear pore complex protein Nup155
MLLALACGNSFLELDDMSMVGTISNLGPQFADVAKQAFYDFGERPHFTERLTHGTGTSIVGSSQHLVTLHMELSALTGDGAGTTSFSGRRQGLAYYFARLVRPIWKTKITKLGWVSTHACGFARLTEAEIGRRVYSS